MTRLLKEYWSSFGLGAMLCLVLAMWISPGGEADWAWELWDEARPVVVGQAKSVTPDGDGVLIHITGEKLRACVFGGIHFYSVDGSGRKSTIGGLRMDRPASAVTRPIGPHDFGIWRVWPTTGARAAEVWVTYRCSSRVVLNQLVVVAL